VEISPNGMYAMSESLFWISVCFVCYTYLLYPLIIVAWSRGSPRRRPRDLDDGELPTVTLIVVVFNEEMRIEDKLRNCAELDYPRDRLEIRIVSDGSTDGTNAILERAPGITVIIDGENRGKPHQLNRAVARCDSEIVAFSDARQLFEPDALRKLVRNMRDERIGAVSGELVFRAPGDHTGASIGLYWTYEKILRKAESAVDSTLGVTGAIYALRRSLYEPIPDDTILDDIEIPLRGFRRGRRVIFEPEAVAFDTAAEMIGVEFQRKVRTLTGNFQLFLRNPWLLNPFANRIFLQSISHKLFRLCVPYALAALLLTSGTHPAAGMRALFWLQALCYGAGAAALLRPPLRRNRLLNFMCVFLTLNAAAVVALIRTILGKTDARWKK
jgi:cellulose synthase/poly-beta-1,6-N-acetylglucosamine synthase-like glycosyltransferase